MANYLTKEKFEELKNELETLKKEGRNEIAERLKRAKEYGDLSENAEYAEAKEAQAQIEVQIIELENILRNATIIKKSSGKGIIEMGATFKTEKNGQKMVFTMVGSEEASPENNLISNESPLGRAFVGKKAGEVVEIETLKGKTKYKILEIE